MKPKNLANLLPAFITLFVLLGGRTESAEGFKLTVFREYSGQKCVSG
jgi:hypothetical protein